MRTVVAIMAAAISIASAAAPEKDVVVVGGALTEIVYALGADKRVAATDTTSLYPRAAQETPKVGYQRSLNAEGILAMKPRLLLATGEAGPPPALAQLKAAGVTIEQMPVDHTMAGMLERVRRVGVALGMPREGEALARRLSAEWDATRAKVAAYPGPRPRVLFILAHAAAPQVAGADTAAHAVIELAGADNVMKDFSGYKPMTAEGIAAAAPDVILVTTQGLEAQGGIDGLLGKPGVALTPAGRTRRVVAIDALELLGFGPRTPRTVAMLAEKVRAK